MKLVNLTAVHPSISSGAVDPFRHYYSYHVRETLVDENVVRKIVHGFELELRDILHDNIKINVMQRITEVCLGPPAEILDE